ncbi:hypothetical protein [cyanobacterium endosymbiont of Epithemia turgida]|uniref:hypothetical protein n=1 Tax=cyanobacterium endosymbiont of Epithemia turgida TaxID=718217 RepID=UPI0004D0F3F1|nr:hypothetical protein [cyanobacterium endosymbiont of Epithemia turgida]BAP18012.1 hypothetical protein ETSB_1256 [cyanobacterium endosymbiont of Epithemia turgida isolate EtSB Lake Yunoko]
MLNPCLNLLAIVVVFGRTYCGSDVSSIAIQKFFLNLEVTLIEPGEVPQNSA